jgi:hypothetical protein
MLAKGDEVAMETLKGQQPILIRHDFTAGASEAKRTISKSE